MTRILQSQVHRLLQFGLLAEIVGVGELIMSMVIMLRSWISRVGARLAIVLRCRLGGLILRSGYSILRSNCVASSCDPGLVLLMNRSGALTVALQLELISQILSLLLEVIVALDLSSFRWYLRLLLQLGLLLYLLLHRWWLLCLRDLSDHPHHAKILSLEIVNLSVFLLNLLLNYG